MRVSLPVAYQSWPLVLRTSATAHASIATETTPMMPTTRARIHMSGSRTALQPLRPPGPVQDPNATISSSRPPAAAHSPATIVSRTVTVVAGDFAAGASRVSRARA